MSLFATFVKNIFVILGKLGIGDRGSGIREQGAGIGDRLRWGVGDKGEGEVAEVAQVWEVGGVGEVAQV